MDGENSMVAEFLYYNRWANLHLIEACLYLTDEQLASRGPGAYGSIYDTLKHILQAEARYYKRLTGDQLDPPFNWETDPPLSEMHSYADRIGRVLAEAAEKIKTSDSFPRDWNDPDWEGQSPRYKAVSMLIQVVNHGVEHRTNITTILAQLDLPAPALDGWEYMRLNPDRLGA